MQNKPPFFDEADVETLAAKFFVAQRSMLQQGKPTVTEADFKVALSPRWQTFWIDLARVACADLLEPDAPPSIHFRPDGQRLTAESAVPTAWTLDERIRVATALLGVIQDDIPAGKYSEVGRPNVALVLSVLLESPALLAVYKDGITEMLKLR